MPLLDEAKATEYIDKTILVGITYLDSNEQLLDQKQWAGTILSFSNREGIKIESKETDSILCLPPDIRGLHPAPPGSYRLRSSGQVIENPDYLATWTCIKPEEDES